MSETDSLREAYNDTARAWLDESHELQRQRDQARAWACEYASRLARIAELLREMQESDRFVPSCSPTVAQRVGAALAVASGAALQVPLRVLVEWALRQQGWERKSDEPLGDRWYAPGGAGWLRFWDAIDYAIEREGAAPAAEAST